jgi:CARDB
MVILARLGRAARFSVLATLVVFLGARGASARTIGMAISTTAEVSAGSLSIQLSLKNHGDEAAHAVSPVVYFGDKSVRGRGTPSLGPNASADETFVIAVGELKPGRWPYRVVVDYADANQYPFQALHIAEVQLGPSTPGKVLLSVAKPEPFADEGEVVLRFRNMAAEAKELTLRVFAPESLELATTPLAIKLPGYAEDEKSITIRTRTALPGSQLPVIATLEYDDQLHHTVMAQTVAETIAARPWMLRARIPFTIAAATLVVAWLTAVIIRRRRRE